MTKDPLKEIGSLIRTTRERLGISIDQLALESRVSSKHIQNIENAQRSDLPEDTFLFSYLSKLFRTLKIPNADQLIDQYRKNEGDYIVQSIIDVQESNAGEGFRDGKYFKVYHLYIAFALFLVLCIWIVINKANEDYEYSPVISTEPIEVKNSNTLFDLFAKLNPINLDKEEEKKEEDKKDSDEKSKKDTKKEEKVENGETLATNGNALQAEVKPESVIEPEKKIIEESTPPPVRRRSVSRGSGAYNVRLGVRDTAWVQVIGVGSKKVLFEGDVSEEDISALDLHDDVGFVLATGNAGAFDVNVGSGNFKLGQSGQLIKWFYPESARTIYKSWSKSQQKNLD